MSYEDCPEPFSKKCDLMTRRCEGNSGIVYSTAWQTFKLFSAQTRDSLTTGAGVTSSVAVAAQPPQLFLPSARSGCAAVAELLSATLPRLRREEL